MENLNPFPKEKLDNIFKAIDKAVADVQTPIAAFDADGTLWSHDAGEQFFEYKRTNQLVHLPKDPWAHYEYLKEHVSHKVAYLWLAQITAGHPLETVRRWSKECTEANSPVPTFEAQKQIIQYLKNKGVEVYIVTASIKWAVEPAAALYGISEDHVIGITTKIKDGIITEKQDGPITYREGKVTGLLEKTNGTSPIFAAGNTEGDLPLLESSSHVKLVMASASKGKDPKMYKTEQHMVQVAKERGWFYHSYVD